MCMSERTKDGFLLRFFASTTKKKTKNKKTGKTRHGEVQIDSVTALNTVDHSSSTPYK